MTYVDHLNQYILLAGSVGSAIVYIDNFDIYKPIYMYIDIVIFIYIVINIYTNVYIYIYIYRFRLNL